MKSTDPASLQNLNDIMLPASVDWWPLASGWYILLGLLFVALTWYIYRSVQHWQKNRYRRAALRELQQLEHDLRNECHQDVVLRQIPILLKRTALSVYPRSHVASLSGESWFEFLNSTVSKAVFTKSTFTTLNTIAYSAGELNNIDLQASAALFNASKSWLKHHQPHADKRLRGSVTEC